MYIFRRKKMQVLYLYKFITEFNDNISMLNRSKIYRKYNLHSVHVDLALEA